jgi:hypothetical protein
MSAIYEVFAGPAWNLDGSVRVLVDEDDRPLLDREIVERWIAEIPEAEGQGNEVTIDGDALMVTIDLDEDYCLRTVAAEVSAAEEPTFAVELRALLSHLLDLAERLAAGLYLEAELITRETVEDHIAEFGADR